MEGTETTLNVCQAGAKAGFAFSVVSSAAMCSRAAVPWHRSGGRESASSSMEGSCSEELTHDRGDQWSSSDTTPLELSAASRALSCWRPASERGRRRAAAEEGGEWGEGREGVGREEWVRAGRDERVTRRRSI